jgi:hypothetical protein
MLNYIVENLFSLNLTQEKSSAKIIMQLRDAQQVTTESFPFAAAILRKKIPNVLYTECFNEENLPFHVEVKNTELGHLYEHILLEYLCQLKVARGASGAMFAGRTRWNWIRDPRGLFYISLNCGLRDTDILPIAIQKTNDLMRFIMEYQGPKHYITKKVSMAGMKNGQETMTSNG